MKSLPTLVVLLFLPALALAQVANVHASQAVPPGAIAWTQCLDGKVDSYINAEAVGTDTAAVILRHEEVHRRQARDSVTATGHCVYPQTAAQLLNLETEAYCASDSVEVNVRHRDPVEVSAQTLFRLLRQFQRAMPAFTIGDSWRKACPGSTHHED